MLPPSEMNTAFSPGKRGKINNIRQKQTGVRQFGEWAQRIYPSNGCLVQGETSLLLVPVGLAKWQRRQDISAHTPQVLADYSRQSNNNIQHGGGEEPTQFIDQLHCFTFV